MNTDTAKNRNAEQAAASESALPEILPAAEVDPEMTEKVRYFLSLIQPDYGTYRNTLFDAPLVREDLRGIELPDYPLSRGLWTTHSRGFHIIYPNANLGYGHQAALPDIYDAAKAFAAGMQAAERAAAERGDELDGTTKQSVSMPKRTWEAIKFLADAEGISRSAWIARAADQAATRAAERTRALAVTAEFIEEFEAEHGPISEANYAEADAILDAITGTNS